MRALIFLSFICLLLGGCGSSEMTTEEKLVGTWLIANAGTLQPYLDSKAAFQSPTMRNAIKNSKLIIRSNGTIKGMIEEIKQTGDPQKPTTQITLLQQWEGKWRLMPSQDAIFVEGTPQERPIKNARPGAKNVRNVQFVNAMPIYFEDERTLNITSENATFQFKLVSREVE